MTKDHREITPLHIWEEYRRIRGTGAELPAWILLYLDCVADRLLYLPFARQSRKQKPSHKIPGNDRVPPTTKEMKKQLLWALMFDPPDSSAFHQYARDNRFDAISILIDHEKGLFADADESDLKTTKPIDLDAAISEACGVDMDQAADLRREATSRREFELKMREILKQMSTEPE